MPEAAPSAIPFQEGASVKVPPHSIDAEKSLLGGLMVDHDSWDNIPGLVSAQDFYRHEHQLIFKAIESLANEHKPFDAIVISEWLNTQGEDKHVGGLAYLARLAKETPSSSNVVAYAQVVREKSILRKLVAASNEINSSVFNPQGRDSKEILDQAEHLIFSIAQDMEKKHQGFVDINELLKKTVAHIEKLHENDDPITGISTGFSDLDALTAGFQRSDLIIIAGRPSMGKTTLAINIATTAAIEHGKSVAIFSMEMPGEQLAMRMMSSLGHIDQSKVRSGKLDDDDWPRITSAMALLQKSRFFIDDSAALTPTEVISRARRLKREHGLDLIVIDYLQLMRVPGKSESRVQEISEISRSLKTLAKELEVPVIALSQLNRSLEQRPNKRPVMSDLRDSGAIEQDADVIAFIYRDEVYNENTEDKGIAEIHIAKQRNGPIGTIKLTFLGKYTKFENYTNTSYGYDEHDYEQ